MAVKTPTGPRSLNSMEPLAAPKDTAKQMAETTIAMT